MQNSVVQSIGIAERAHSMNEDTHRVIRNFRGHKGEDLILVCDGHSGRGAAKLIPQVLPAALELALPLAQDTKVDEMRKVLQRAFVGMDELIESIDKESGACVALVLFFRHRFLSVNAGDCRTVLDRSGEAFRLSYDHSASDPFEQERIREAGGEILDSPFFDDYTGQSGTIKRVNGKISITRSLGDAKYRDLVIPDPHVTETQLQPGDQWVITASDGLWWAVDDQKAVDLIRGISNAQTAAEVLRDAAQDVRDDITVVVAKLKRIKRK